MMSVDTAFLLGAITPEALAREMGWGAKRVRQLAKRLGACRILGNRMALLPEDVQTILEFTKCRSSSNVAKTAVVSTTTAGLLPDIDCEGLLVQLTATKRSAKRSRSKPNTATVIPLPRRTS